MSKIYSAFPGCGKTTYYKECMFRSDRIVIDSDSSAFDKSQFPQNYIQHIKKANETDVITVVLISSHDVVRDALLNEGIYYNLVYPEQSLKDEYIQRYKDRGSNEAFIKLVEDNWDKWMEEMDNQPNCNKIRLKTGQYLSDVM